MSKTRYIWYVRHAHLIVCEATNEPEILDGRETMLNFYLLPFLILFTLSADRISCTPIQEKAHEPSSHSSITITP